MLRSAYGLVATRVRLGRHLAPRGLAEGLPLPGIHAAAVGRVWAVMLIWWSLQSSDWGSDLHPEDMFLFANSRIQGFG